MESTRFKTGVLVKKVHRAGLLKKVVKMDNGSTVATENLAYDAHTGAVLLTRTNNDFDDPVYSMRFPAYWRYQGMGPAYKNIGNVMPSITLSATGNASIGNAPAWFSPGDECALTPTSGAALHGWVDQVNESGIAMIDADGDPITGTYALKILRSGSRNMQGQDMMTVISYSDPLVGLAGNVYQNVVNSKAVEFESEWNTECACTEGATTGNPWTRNEKGVWRLARERVWLADRTRSVANRNSDLRMDGIYSEFNPLYAVANGNWDTDPQGWTVSRRILNYGPLGQELENTDALGIPTTALFGHRGTLPIAVARNARYREVGFTSFEDPVPPNCADKHFVFTATQHTEMAYHSGRRAAKVTNTPLSLTTPMSPCYLVDHCKTYILPDFENHLLDIAGTNGIAEVIVDVLEGDVQFNFYQNQELPFTSNGPWVARITAVDSEGCRLSVIINSRHHRP